MSGLFQAVPSGYVLTSGANSALTWTNALTTSTVNTSSISTNAMTLSLTNVSTQNTQIYQVATTDPLTSYTAIQASHVSTGTTNNALALNPSGGNVGVGVTTASAPLHVNTASSGLANGVLFVNSNNTLSTAVNSSDILQQWSESTGNGNNVNLLWNRTTAGSDWTTASQRFQARTDASWQGFIEFNGTNNNNGVTIGAGNNTSNPNSVSSVMTIKTGGNVGIGTTAPQAALHVQGGSLFTNPTVYNTAVAGWFIIGLWDCSIAPSAGARLKLRIMCCSGYDNGATNNQMGGETTIYMSNLNNANTTTVANVDGLWKHEGGLTPITQVKAVQNGSSRSQYYLYAYVNAYTQHSINADTTQGTIWTSQFTSTTDPGANSLTVRALTLSTAVVGTNVGIGETTPLTALHIKNSTSNPASQADNDAATGHILLRNTKTGASPYSMVIGVDQTTGAGYINAAGNGAVQPVCLNTRGGYVGIGRIDPPCPLYLNGGAGTTGWAGQTYIGNTTRGVILGTLNNIATIGGHNAALDAWENLCINSGGGNVGIGTTAPGYKLDVTGDVRIRGPTNGSGNSQALWIDNVDGGGLYSSYTRIRSVYEGSAGNILKLNTGHVATFVGGTTVYFDGYTSNGTLSIINANGQIGVSSDRRIKENIVYQSDTQQGLASVLNLKPATFNMIGSSDSHLGFIAQDLEQDIPLAVDGKKYEWQWEITEDDKPKFDANGDIVYKLDADGNKIVRPRGVSDRAIIATQTLAIQELAKKLTAAEQQLAAKSAALDALIAWAQTQGYSVGA